MRSFDDSQVWSQISFQEVLSLEENITTKEAPLAWDQIKYSLRSHDKVVDGGNDEYQSSQEIKNEQIPHLAVTVYKMLS